MVEAKKFSVVLYSNELHVIESESLESFLTGLLYLLADLYGQLGVMVYNEILLTPNGPQKFFSQILIELYFEHYENVYFLEDDVVGYFNASELNDKADLKVRYQK